MFLVHCIVPVTFAWCLAVEFGLSTIPEVSLGCFVHRQRSNLRFEHILVALNYCFSTINKEKKINKLSELGNFVIKAKSLISVIFRLVISN